MIRAGGVAGILASVIWLVVVLVVGATRGNYDPIRDSISRGATGPDGAPQAIAFVVTGALMTVFAVGLHLAVGPGPLGILGPATLVVRGVALGALTFLPVDVVPSPHQTVSTIGGTAFLVGALALVPRLRADARHRHLVWYTVATVAVAGFLALVLLLPALPLLGAVQRLYSFVATTWFFVMGLALLRSG